MFDLIKKYSHTTKARMEERERKGQAGNVYPHIEDEVDEPSRSLALQKKYSFKAHTHTCECD